MTGCAGSGTYIYGNVFSLEDDTRGPGVVLNIEGSSCPPSAPSAAGNGKVQAEIPMNLMGASAYLYLTGTFNSGTAMQPLPQKVWHAPSGLLDPNASLIAIYHFIYSDSVTPGLLDEVRKSLIGHGDIASSVGSGQFLMKYHFMVGLLMEHRSGTEVIYHGYSVQVDGLDNTGCKPDTQCCVYYGQDFAGWKQAPTASYLDFTATSGQPYFMVICPSNHTADVTLHQSQTDLTKIADGTNVLNPTVPFPDLTVAVKQLGDVVSVAWFNK
jgi:hypothetical protein